MFLMKRVSICLMASSGTISTPGRSFMVSSFGVFPSPCPSYCYSSDLANFVGGRTFLSCVISAKLESKSVLNPASIPTPNLTESQIFKARQIMYTINEASNPTKVLGRWHKPKLTRRRIGLLKKLMELYYPGVWNNFCNNPSGATEISEILQENQSSNLKKKDDNSTLSLENNTIQTTSASALASASIISTKNILRESQPRKMRPPRIKKRDLLKAKRWANVSSILNESDFEKMRQEYLEPRRKQHIKLLEDKAFSEMIPLERLRNPQKLKIPKGTTIAELFDKGIVNKMRKKLGDGKKNVSYKLMHELSKFIQPLPSSETIDKKINPYEKGVSSNTDK